MFYITVAEFESPGSVTCKVQGLSADTTEEMVNVMKTKDIKYSKDPNFFEMDAKGVDVLNTLGKIGLGVISQSTVIEVSNIGGRMDKVQKTIWTLGKE